VRLKNGVGDLRQKLQPFVVVVFYQILMINSIEGKLQIGAGAIHKL
jgi:hypothetical protein